MENKKHTKKALFGSVIALILCCAMLIGTTFAWFTDTASTNVNKIESGTLDVDLVDETGNTVVGQTLNFIKADGTDEILWEPGCTYTLPAVAVKNNGNLALKYRLVVNGVDGDAKLLEAIEWTMKVGENDIATEGHLTAGQTSAPITITGHMKESAGNEYQNLSIKGIAITVVATQDAVEYDSFNNTYDQNATYPDIVNSAEELSAAVTKAEGANILLAADVDYGTVTLGSLKNVTISGAEGATVTIKTDANTTIENVTLSNMEFKYTGDSADFAVVCADSAKIDNLVIENSTFTGDGTKNGRGLSGYNNTASITIKNCTFKDLGYPVYAWGGYASLTIDTCTFDNIKSWAIMPQSGFDGDLTVNKCTFKNCLGGGLIKAGTLTAGHTFTFTNNTVTGCTVAGDHNWFQFNVSAGTSVINGNTKDGAAWTPGADDGLK